MVFGKVLEGMDVVKKMEMAGTTSGIPTKWEYWEPLIVDV